MVCSSVVPALLIYPGVFRNSCQLLGGGGGGGGGVFTTPLTNGKISAAE